MDKFDKAKLKVLVKMILIQQSPNYLTGSQLATIINTYNWGFNTSVTSQKIGKILGYELSKRCNHFLDDVRVFKKNGVNVYQYCGGVVMV